MLHLRLVRRGFYNDRTEGYLCCENNGHVICETIEPPIGFDPFGHGEAIPAGTYALKEFDSPAIGKKCLKLCDVPGRSFILMHYGRSVKNSRGCILCGDLVENGYLNNSNMTDVLLVLFHRYYSTGIIEIGELPEST